MISFTFDMSSRIIENSVSERRAFWVTAYYSTLYIFISIYIDWMGVSRPIIDEDSANTLF